MSHLTRFLQSDLSIPAEAIPMVLQQCGSAPNRLAVVLWQNRLINLSQLDQIFSWMELYTSSRPAETN